MLKAYRVNSYYKVDDEDWEICGCGKTVLMQEFKNNINVDLVFDGADWDTIYDCDYDGIYSSVTWLRNRPYIMTHCWHRYDGRRFYKDSFKKFSYAKVYREDTDCSIDWLVKNMPAELVIQYMKERGMTICPMQ